MEKNRLEVTSVLQLRARLSDLLSHGVLARLPFRRVPALRALLAFLDTLPLDTPDALAFAAPLPPPVIGGVVLPGADSDAGISVPAALLRLHLAPEAWNPTDELERQLAIDAAQAAAQWSPQAAHGDVSTPTSPSAAAAAAGASMSATGGAAATSLFGKSFGSTGNGAAANNSNIAIASSVFHTPGQQLIQQMPFQLFVSSISAVEVELAWRILQGVCVLSPSQQAQAADERVLEAAMAHVRHALSVSPLIEREFTRHNASMPSGSTAHALSVLRVALAAMPAVEVMLRRSVAALRLAVSSGFIPFLFGSVLGNQNCCRSLRTAALDLVSTTLWDCHYCVPRGVVALLGGAPHVQHQQQQTSAQQWSLQQQQQTSSSSRPGSARAAASAGGRSTPPIAEAPTPRGGATNNPQQQPQQQQQQQSSGGGAGNVLSPASIAANAAALEATAADCEIASAISALITVVRAELVLLEKRGGNNSITGAASGGGGVLQTVDDLLFALIHLRDPSGISYWTILPPPPPPAEDGNTTSSATAAPVAPIDAAGAALTSGAGTPAAGATPSQQHTEGHSVSSAGLQQQQGDGHHHHHHATITPPAGSSSVAMTPSGSAMPSLRLGGLSFLNSIAATSARTEAGAMDRMMAAAAAGRGAHQQQQQQQQQQPSPRASAASGIPQVPLGALRSGGGGGAVPDSARRAAPLNLSSRQPAGADGAAMGGGSMSSPNFNSMASGVRSRSGVFQQQQQQQAPPNSGEQQQQQQQQQHQPAGSGGYTLSLGGGSAVQQLRRSDYLARMAAANAAAHQHQQQQQQNAASGSGRGGGGAAAGGTTSGSNPVDLLLSALQKN